MAISDIKEYAHLTEADVEALGRELDAIRREIEESRGEADAAYIRNVIKLQRGLAAAGRVTLFASLFPPAWVAGTAMLGLAKIIENMEIGHNVIHGQWDWMNDPEIHSSTWEWDTACPSEQWKHSHNFVHHTYTNVIGKDNDVGYGILRVTRDQKWHPINLGQPVYNALLARSSSTASPCTTSTCPRSARARKTKETAKRQLKRDRPQGRRQVGKDYVLFPALTGPAFVSTLTANVTANLIRNLWSYTVIFCGHFPDGAEKFTERGVRERDPRRVVPAPDARLGQLQGRQAADVHERQPQLPDRAPPVPRPAEQPLRRRSACRSRRSAPATRSLTRQATSWCSTARRSARS